MTDNGNSNALLESPLPNDILGMIRERIGGATAASTPFAKKITSYSGQNELHFNHKEVFSLFGGHVLPPAEEVALSRGEDLKKALCHFWTKEKKGNLREREPTFWSMSLDIVAAPLTRSKEGAPFIFEPGSERDLKVTLVCRLNDGSVRFTIRGGFGPLLDALQGRKIGATIRLQWFHGSRQRRLLVATALPPP